MVIESKEEVFEWFKGLSGAERVEVMSGLCNISIPLEWRLFGTVIENLGRRDYLVLREDEHRANSLPDIEEVCAQPWLDTTPLPAKQPSPPPPPPTPASVASPGAPDTTAAPIVNGVATSSNGTSPSSSPHDSRNGSPAPSSDASQPAHPPPSSVRSKVVIYLCLLHSTNRVCATAVAKAFKLQLSLEVVQKHVEKLQLLREQAAKALVQQQKSVTASKSPRDPSPQSAMQRKNSAPVANATLGHDLRQMLTKAGVTISEQSQAITSVLEQAIGTSPVFKQFVAEVKLLFTIAIHHPAFSFDQKTLLQRQFNKVRNYLDKLSVDKHKNANHGLAARERDLSPSSAISSNSGSTSPSMQPPLTGAPTVLTAAGQHEHPAVAYQPPWAPALPVTNANFQMWPPPPSITVMNALPPQPVLYYTNPVPETTVLYALGDKLPRITSCYNCGEQGHVGGECKAETLDDATRASTFLALLAASSVANDSSRRRHLQHRLHARADRAARAGAGRRRGDDRLRARRHHHRRAHSAGREPIGDNGEWSRGRAESDHDHPPASAGPAVGRASNAAYDANDL